MKKYNPLMKKDFVLVRRMDWVVEGDPGGVPKTWRAQRT